MSNQKTTITVKPSTKHMLARLGAKGDSFDRIIQRLIEDKQKAINEPKPSDVVNELREGPEEDEK